MTTSLVTNCLSIQENLHDIEDRELGSEAIFTISSAKPGNGVEQLRDNNLETFWQSDGSFPHYINIQFLRKMDITKLCIYLDFASDESYTPKKIAISIGTCLHDIIDVVQSELTEQVGWVVVDLYKAPLFETEGKNFVSAHFIQIRVLSMHQNGKDTHVRQVKVFGKRQTSKVMGEMYHDDFKTVTMSQFCVIR